MLEYIIWDFDGVLCDSLHIAFETHNEICEKYNVELKQKNKEQYKKLINSDNFEKYFYNKDNLNDYFLNHRKKLYEKRYEIKLFNKTMKIINNMAIPSIIITATDEKLVKEILKNNNYDCNIFKYIIGRETANTKAERLEYLIKKININKNNLIYIGDSLSDVKFCNNQHIRMIAVSYGYCPKKLLKKQEVEKICDTPQELKKFLETYI